MTRWQAFRFISDALRSLSGGETLSIDAERVSWDLVLQLASEHFVTTTLAWALREARSIPDDVRDFLSVTLDLNRQRNEIILDCLESALAALNSAGCEPLLLKGGAALLDDGLYPDRSVRYLTDLDILIPKSRLRDASAALNKIGFRAISDPRRRWVRPRAARDADDSHHLPALFHDVTGVCVELHRTISLPEFEPILPTVTVLNRRTKHCFRGRDLFVPCPTDLIIHNIVHSQLHHRRDERDMVELRQLFELALLTAKFAQEIDWQEVENRFRTAGRLEVLQSQAAIVQTIFAVDLKISGSENPDLSKRLQSSIEYPPLVSNELTLARIMSAYCKQFIQSPLLAINLLNPFWWPERISFIRRKVWPEKTTTTGSG